MTDIYTNSALYLPPINCQLLMSSVQHVSYLVHVHIMGAFNTYLVARRVFVINITGQYPYSVTYRGGLPSRHSTFTADSIVLRKLLIQTLVSIDSSRAFLTLVSSTSSREAKPYNLHLRTNTYICPIYTCLVHRCLVTIHGLY